MLARLSFRAFLLLVSCTSLSLLAANVLSWRSGTRTQLSISRQLRTTTRGPLPGQNSTLLIPRSILLSSTSRQVLVGRPPGTTLHFTLGTLSMTEFALNWHHFVLQAKLSPAIIGAADAAFFRACEERSIPVAALHPAFDLRRGTLLDRPVDGGDNSGTATATSAVAGLEHPDRWQYFRHHRAFLRFGLLKASFIAQWLASGYSVLFSDLDVVWLSAGWESWAVPAAARLPEARLTALADVLLSTDELDVHADERSGSSPSGVLSDPSGGGQDGFGFGVHFGQLNTGVAFFRASIGAMALVSAWRRALVDRSDGDDQTTLHDVVRSSGLRSTLTDGAAMSSWREALRADAARAPADAVPPGAADAAAEAAAALDAASTASTVHTRDVLISSPQRQAGDTASNATGGGAQAGARATYPEARFSLGTLPARVVLSGHAQFVQHVASHDQLSSRAVPLPQHTPLAVHLTYQSGDTPQFALGKRQRAREAGLWVADPPEYYSEGAPFVQLDGPLYSEEERRAVEALHPESDPRRHLRLDALQRSVLRDLLALSLALNGTLVLPRLRCSCDRSWGLLASCRVPRDMGHPHGPSVMALPAVCPSDNHIDLERWRRRGLRFREPGFLEHPAVPQRIRDAAVFVAVRRSFGPEASPGSSARRFSARLLAGTPMSAVLDAVHRANGAAGVVEIDVAGLRLLCKWLGSADANRRFNEVMRDALAAKHDFCTQEANPHFPGWRHFDPARHRLNCSRGFAPPTDYSPAPRDATAGAFQETCRHNVAERPSSELQVSVTPRSP